MIKSFLIIIALLCPSLVLADEEKKIPQTFEDIAAELNAKKKELEPFDRKKVKIDLESLGLDDVDNPVKNDDKSKGEAKILDGQKTVLIEKKILEEKPQEAIKEQVEVKEQLKEQDLAAPNSVAKPDTNTDVPATSSTTPSLAAPSTKNTDNKKLAKKPQPGKRISYKKSKKSRTKNEKIQTVKSQELNELRKKYLAKFNEKKTDNIVEQDEEIVVPRRKEIGKFYVSEPPPPPILNRFRTKDNLHIPIIATKQEMNELLFDAAASDNISFFTDVYKDLENPNAKNKNGDTLLTFTVLLKKYSVMASLLDKGADPNMPNKLGYSPLDIAIELLDSKSFEILFHGGADINYVDGLGRTYLMHAAKVGFLPGVEMLVDKGVDINAMDNDGFTALAVAYRYKRDVIVKYLLRHNAKTWIEKPYDPDSQSMMRGLEERWK